MLRTNLSYNLKLSILFFVIQAILDLFFATFFVSFVMQLSLNQILSVSMYKLFEYIATCAGYFIIADWCKRKDIRSVFVLKQIPQILLLLVILFLGEHVVDYIIILGMLYGLGRALYFLPMHNMINRNTNEKNLTRFTGVKNSCVYAVKIIVPIILGFFIDTNSYTEMAYAMLVVSLLECAFLFLIKPMPSNSTTPINYKKFINCVMRFPVMRQFFFMKVLRGFSMGMLGTIITMYTVYIFRTDLNLGILTTIFAICSVVVSWLFGRYGNKRYHAVVMFVCLVALFVAVLLLVYKTTKITFLIYSFVFSTAVVLIDCISSFSVYALSQSVCVQEDNRTEFFVLRDFALFLGRWFCLVILMYIGFFGGFAHLRWFLLLITFVLIIYGTLQIRVSRHLRERN